MSHDWEIPFMDEESYHSPRRLVKEAPIAPGALTLAIAPPDPLPKVGEGRFVRLSSSTDAGSTSAEWVVPDNRMPLGFDTAEQLCVPSPADFKDRTTGLRLQYKTKSKLVRDFSGTMGYAFAMSTRLLELFLRFDPDAIMHAPVEVRFKDGSEPPPDRRLHLVFVRRVIYAADLDHSVVRARRERKQVMVAPGIRHPRAPDPTSPWIAEDIRPIAFRHGIPDHCHVFKQLLGEVVTPILGNRGPRAIHDNRNAIFVSRELAAAIGKARYGNVSFGEPAGAYDIVSQFLTQGEWPGGNPPQGTPETNPNCPHIWFREHH